MVKFLLLLNVAYFPPSSCSVRNLFFLRDFSLYQHSSSFSVSLPPPPAPSPHHSHQHQHGQSEMSIGWFIFKKFPLRLFPCTEFECPRIRNKKFSRCVAFVWFFNQVLDRYFTANKTYYYEDRPDKQSRRSPLPPHAHARQLLASMWTEFCCRTVAFLYLVSFKNSCVRRRSLWT